MSVLSVNLVTPPAVEPVTLDQLKTHLRVDASFTDDDALLMGFITAAREWCESYMRRAIFNQTWQMTLDHFPYWTEFGTMKPASRLDYMYGSYFSNLVIELPKPKLVSVTSITYVDATGTQQTLDPSQYRADLTSEPARLSPAAGLYWPMSQQFVPGSVKITYVAGSYGDGEDVNTCPQSISIAVCMLAGHFNEQRNGTSGFTVNEIPFGVRALLNMYRTVAAGYSQGY